jgi:hypothetical protein
VAAYRPWPQDRRLTVEQAWRQEKPLLLPLPADRFPCHEQIAASVRRTPYVAFDTNRYSIPHDRIDRTLTLLADPDEIRIFDREAQIATHRRCWDKEQLVELPQHLEALWQAKHQARLHRNQDRLLRAIPAAQKLLVALAKRQSHLATAVDHLLRLLDEHGRDELMLAIDEALAAGSPHPDTVRLVLDRRRAQRGQPPPIAIELPDDPRLRDLVVIPHPLADYDPEDES